MTDIAQIVEGIVQQMDITITGVEDPSNPGYLLFCDTKWARKGKLIYNVGNNGYYRVVEIDYDQTIYATPYQATSIYMAGTYWCPVPFFISGTRKATNLEWTKADINVMKKTPIIWLLETIEEEHFGRGDTREFEAQLRLFFLDETNIKDYVTEDHRHEVVVPMQKLVSQFVQTINDNRSFKPIESFKMKTFSRFGVEQEDGMFKNILDANLSGVELNITLTKFKENCKC